ncbi:calcium-binding protein [Schinkia azotoformans]|uniref:calcium-binding protein n=1 Tax=Schinkia azotoformans TaxID=1454 RepID=UPI001268DA01|nr:calcium-binding protein [Schinkia azotoformans]
MYLFGRGSSQDTIYDNDSTAGNTDIIRIVEGTTSSDVVVKRNGDHLELSIEGTQDKLTIQNYFYRDYYLIEKIEFADGTIWDTAFIKAEAIKATEENDVIYGYNDRNDQLSGLGGNDTLYGVNGDDELDGGANDDQLYGGNGSDILWGGSGQDTLYGEYGNDVLRGGEGNDSLYGGNDNDELDGGAGNDYLEGSSGNDVYLFGRGSGQDTIHDYDSTAGNTDIIRIVEGTIPSDVVVRRKGDHLELSIEGTQDKLTIQNYFYRDYYLIEKIEFADGTIWDTAFIKAEAIKATEENDVIYGYNDRNDQLSGLGGNDTLYGVNGDDELDGGANDDQLYGGNGSDILWGGSGQDTLYGEYGNDVLRGGEGNDSLYGGNDNDELDGGAGNDYLEGSSGNDVYLFGRDSGQDTIYDYDSTAGNTDIIRIAEGTTSSNVVVKRKGDHLELSIEGTLDKLTIQNYFYHDYYKIEKIEFADGTVWDTAFIKAEAIKATEENDLIRGYDGVRNNLYGLGGNDILYGANGEDRLDGGAGDDKVYGGNGADIVLGGSGQDTIYGEDGNDLLDGGQNNDYLSGGYGNDIYVLGKNFGQDTIYDYDYNDTRYGSVDTLQFDVSALDLIFTRENSDLKIIVQGTENNVNVQSWFSSSAYQTEVLKTADGNLLFNTQVEQLIQAMASFTETAGMSWNQALQEKPAEVSQLLAQYWKPQNEIAG